MSTSLYSFLRGPLKLFLPCMYFFPWLFSPSKLWFYLYFKICWKFCIYLRLSLFLVYITLSLMTGFVLRSPFSSWMSKWGNATGPEANDVNCFLVNDDGWLLFEFYHLNKFSVHDDGYYMVIQLQGKLYIVTNFLLLVMRVFFIILFSSPLNFSSIVSNLLFNLFQRILKTFRFFLWKLHFCCSFYLFSQYIGFLI